MHQIKGVTRKLIWKVLKQSPDLGMLYRWNTEQWAQLFEMKLESAKRIRDGLTDIGLQREIVRQSREYAIITIFDSFYPDQLRNIPDPPVVLYAAGNLSLLKHTPNLSVVGTRYPTENARPVMNRLLKPLLQKGWLIVSGMAIGIDGCAHELALANGSPTIAVLGGGFEHIYPKQNAVLFHEISQKGLVISEYPPYLTPQKYHFPERNRIISGLTFGTLVIEAKTKSGSMITVDQALEQGREVFAVPGSVLNKTSEGCHQLIQDGAKLVQTAMDIESEWYKESELTSDN
ncbi:DNA processing protein [Gracilibacillus ureilyticus]|uniref:DNA processing protein n=1 Tax=Gracilibacillus ureilyticus TaxID=531814 RepID=A0A1H9L3P1_9BACI|nr:DNA processing protein [Gracilibacillus ureilyticus]